MLNCELNASLFCENLEEMTNIVIHVVALNIRVHYMKLTATKEIHVTTLKDAYLSLKGL